ncbi:MAG TPA: energy-coupling factor ABC transporter permease [Verrucomicrobiae bacterium]|nr:energy-coupling factor ABC transporter permease [Verrucomicrobiae bacterium]
MHLPDGFLDTKTALLSSGAAAGAVGLALRQVSRSLEPRRMPMLGLGAAFVFAAQMLNFPIAGGTSGHLVGGVLAAILLGPSAGVLVMTCVLLVQCLVFADGGLTAFGANVLNMGLVNVCGGYFVFRLIKGAIRMDQQRSTVFAAAFAGWFGTVLGSIVCAGELALSKTVPWSVAFPAMAYSHMVIGAAEGLATALVVLAVMRARPDLVPGEPVSRLSFSAVGYGIIICVALALFVAPFACPWPDALEAFAQKLGLHSHPGNAPLADYHFPRIGSATLATAVAGAVGTVLAFAAAYGLARVAVPVLGTTKKDASPGN